MKKKRKEKTQTASKKCKSLEQNVEVDAELARPPKKQIEAKQKRAEMLKFSILGCDDHSKLWPLERGL
jgi:hypothetical protein